MANILDDLTYNQKVLGIGGATVGGLGIGKALEYSHDINKINQWSNMGYGKGNPVPTKLRDTLKGSWVPNKTFEKMGLGPGSTKNWFFNTISDKHFTPIQNTMQFAKNIPGYAMKGLGYLASLPTQAALMTLHSTPVNADEVEWEKQLMKNQQFKQQQLMNRRKQDMQQRIREAEAAEEKRIEQEKIKTAQKNWKPTYNPASSHAEAQATGGDYHSGHESTVDGQTTDWGPSSHMIARGGLAQHAPRYANGGLIDFFRYGGFIG